jgi:hypothetical protein
MTLVIGALALMAIPVTVAVFGAIVPRSPTRRQDALRALELLVRRRDHRLPLKDTRNVAILDTSLHTSPASTLLRHLDPLRPSNDR